MHSISCMRYVLTLGLGMRVLHTFHLMYEVLTLGIRVLQTFPVLRSSMSIPPVGGAYKPYLEIKITRYLFYIGKNLTPYKSLINYGTSRL
jgi:hypothetical protein